MCGHDVFGGGDMTELRLPALDGRIPLAWLAALGVLRLVSLHSPGDGRPEARLRWDQVDAVAVLCGAHDDIGSLASDLVDIVSRIPDGGVLPGLPPTLPPPGEAPDKLRLTRGAFRPAIEDLLAGASLNAEEAEAWLAALVTDLAVDDKGRASVSQWTAPAGKQSLRTMMEKPLGLVRRRPEELREALEGWRRTSGYTGEYLDNLATFKAAESQDGTAAMRGVAGATWLALMAFPLLPMTGQADTPVSSGWRRDGRRRVAVMPLWRDPLDLAAVQVVIRHPLFQVRTTGTGDPVLPTARRRAAQELLGVFSVTHAVRRKSDDDKNAGILTPVQARPASSAR